MEDKFILEALKEAQKSLAENAIPIGAVFVVEKKIVGRGYNRRVQKGSPILHAEMEALENAGRLKTGQYKKSVLYTTLSPYDMCCGAILLYKIPRVVIGDSQNFKGAEEYYWYMTYK